MTARRAIWRWGLRMIRLEWRSHLTVTALIGAAVCLSIGGALTAYHATPPDLGIDRGLSFTLDGTDEAKAEFLAELGDVGVLQMARVGVTGSTTSVNVRALDPSVAALRPLLDVIDGQAPRGPHQVALTNGASSTLAATIGDSVNLAGQQFEVSGLVENPTDLDDEFALVDHQSPPELALQTRYLTTASLGDIESLPFDGSIGASESSGPRQVITVAVNAAMVLAMLLVGLLASASFAIAARRRVRQYGLLGAIGAEPSEVAGSAAFTGLVVGAIAAAVGAPLGVAAARGVLPQLEEELGHRVDFSVPLTIWLPTVAAAVVMAGIASWWPARAISRQPIVEALAARRPRSRPIKSVSLLGVLLVVAGYALVGWGAARQSAVAVIAGLPMAIAGVLLLTPAAVTLIGRLARGPLLPLRVAGRDLARFQGRSAAALGAVVIALAIPVGVGTVTAAIDKRTDVQPPNLDTRTAIVWAPDVDHSDAIRLPLEVDVATGARAADRAQAILPDASVTPIRVAVDLTIGAFQNDDGVPTRGAHEALTLIDCGKPINGNTWSWGDEDGDGTCFRAHILWVVDRDAAALWGIDTSSLATPNTLAARSTIDFFLAGADGEVRGPPTEPANVMIASFPDFGSFPDAMISDQVLGNGFGIETVGWALTNPDPLTPSQILNLRNAMGQGSEIETQDIPPARTGLRTTAALVGAFAGLAVLAATVLLIRGETSSESRVLTALGAPQRLRRSIAGYTAALIAPLGAGVLAIPLGYVALVVARSVTDELPFAVPWSTLFVVLICFPAAASVTAALFSRSHDDGLARIPTG